MHILTTSDRNTPSLIFVILKNDSVKVSVDMFKKMNLTPCYLPQHLAQPVLSKSTALVLV